MHLPPARRSWRVLVLCLTACGSNADEEENYTTAPPPPCPTQYYWDWDADGLGNPLAPVDARDGCTPEGSVENADDREPLCPTNDTDECDVCAGEGRKTFFLDADRDNVADLPATEMEACALAPGLVAQPRTLPQGCELAKDGASCLESAQCDTDCTAASCGDAVRNPTAGEECDTGWAGTIDDRCIRCRPANGEWKIELAEAATQACVAGGAVYVAMQQRIYKIGADGAMAWQLALDQPPAVLACDATHGVAAVMRVFEGDRGSLSYQRWLPTGTPAHGRLDLGAGTGALLTLREDASAVVVQLYLSAGVEMAALHEVPNAEAPVIQHYASWYVGGTVWAFSLSGGTFDLLSDRLQTSEFHWYGGALTSTRLSTDNVLQLHDFNAILLRDGVATAFAGNTGYRFDAAGTQAWNPPVQLLRGTRESFAALNHGAGDHLLIATWVDDRLLVTELSAQGDVMNVLETGLVRNAGDVRFVGTLGAAHIVLMNVAGGRTVLRSADFALRSAPFAGAPIGAACKVDRECASTYCGLRNVCETTSAAVGDACTLNRNCAGFLCLGGRCAAGNLPAGSPCSHPEECSSQLCTASGCG